MSRWSVSPVCVLLLAAVLTGGISVPSFGSVQTRPHEVWLAFQGHVHGRLLPAYAHCGYDAPKMGGVARRAACVESLRSLGLPMVLVDSGNFFASDDRAKDVKSVAAWKEMERLGYDAVTLGRREVENWELVKELLRESELALVTTNLEMLRGDDWVPVGARHLVVERDGLRMGVLGLLPPSEIPEWMIRSADDSLRIRPMDEAVTQAREELGSGVDLVVALVADTPRHSRAPAPGPLDADVVIHGRSSCTIGGTATSKAYTGGCSLGLTRLVVSPLGGIASYEDRTMHLTEGMAVDSVIAEDAQKVEDLSWKLQWQARPKKGLWWNGRQY